MKMTTGDLKNNLRLLQRQLKTVLYPHDIDIESLGNGTTKAFLPIYHYAFLEYSQPFCALLVELKQDLFFKTDLKFIEAMYKVLREVFSYKPPVTRDQFFSAGFAECKVIMCAQILALVHQRHASLAGNRAVPPATTGSNAAPRKPTTVVNNLSAAAGNVPAAFGGRVVVMQECVTGVAVGGGKDGGVKGRGRSLTGGEKAKAGRVGQLVTEPHDVQVSVTREKDVISPRTNPPLRPGDSDMALEPSRSAILKREAIAVVRETVAPQLGMDQGREGAVSSMATTTNGGSGLPGSEDFVLSILSSVSQTMLQLVAKIDGINERLCRLESTACCHLGNKTEPLSSPRAGHDSRRDGTEREAPSIERRCLAETEREGRKNVDGWPSRSSEGVGERGGGIGAEALMQNLSNIGARLTLLENSVTLLNSRQSSFVADDSSTVGPPESATVSSLGRNKSEFDDIDSERRSCAGLVSRSALHFSLASSSTLDAALDGSGRHSNGALDTSTHSKSSAGSLSSQDATRQKSSILGVNGARYLGSESRGDFSTLCAKTSSVIGQSQLPGNGSTNGGSASPVIADRRQDQANRIFAMFEKTQMMLQNKPRSPVPP